MHWLNISIVSYVCLHQYSNLNLTHITHLLAMRHNLHSFHKGLNTHWQTLWMMCSKLSIKMCSFSFHTSKTYVYLKRLIIWRCTYCFGTICGRRTNASEQSSVCFSLDNIQLLDCFWLVFLNEIIVNEEKCSTEGFLLYKCQKHNGLM